jgi:Ribonuclease G/E
LDTIDTAVLAQHIKTQARNDYEMGVTTKPQTRGNDGAQFTRVSAFAGPLWVLTNKGNSHHALF